MTTPRRIPVHALADALDEADWVYCGDGSQDVGLARLLDAIWRTGHRVVETGSVHLQTALAAVAKDQEGE